MLVAIWLNEGALTLGDTVDPLTLVDSPVSLKHATASMTFVTQEVASILYPS